MVIHHLLILKKQKMKNQYKTLALTFLVLSSLVSKAQQQPNFLFFEQNMNLFNPAYTGSHGSFAAMHYRSAWSGTDGAPRAASFLYTTSEKNNAAWGFSFLSDRVNIENNGLATIDYSYKLAFGGNTNLYLGIKAGVSFNNFDLDRLNRITQENNPNLSNLQNYMNPLVGIGALLKSKNYFLGLSSPNILHAKRFKEDAGVVATAMYNSSVYGTVGFYVKLNTFLRLSPSMVYRMVSDAPNQLTAITKIELKEKLSLGVGLSNNDYISTMFQVKLPKMDLGFGYEIGQNTSSTAIRANTAEIMLVYRFDGKKPSVESSKGDEKLSEN